MSFIQEKDGEFPSKNPKNPRIGKFQEHLGKNSQALSIKSHLWQNNGKLNKFPRIFLQGLLFDKC